MYGIIYSMHIIANHPSNLEGNNYKPVQNETETVSLANAKSQNEDIVPC